MLEWREFVGSRLQTAENDAAADGWTHATPVTGNDGDQRLQAETEGARWFQTRTEEAMRLLPETEGSWRLNAETEGDWRL